MSLDTFGTSQYLTWAQESARTAVVFCYAILLVRLAGRRVFGKWSALDIIVSVVVGSNLSRALTGNAELWGTLAASTLLILLHWLFFHGAARSPALSQLLEGPAIRLGDANGVKGRALARHAVSDADLREAFHRAGLEEITGARLVILEPSGRISVLKHG